jgi:hypothetical protein
LLCCCCAGALEAPLGNAVAARSNSVGAAAAAAAANSSQHQQQQQLDAAAGISPTSSLNLSVADLVTDTGCNAPKYTAGTGLSSVDSEQHMVQQSSIPPWPASKAAYASSSIGNSHWQQQQQQMDPQLSLPMPAVTMVFLVVEGAKVFGKGRRQLVKEVHAQLSQLLVEALKHVAGGYLCRMQVRYMILVLCQTNDVCGASLFCCTWACGVLAACSDAMRVVRTVVAEDVSQLLCRR